MSSWDIITNRKKRMRMMMKLRSKKLFKSSKSAGSGERIVGDDGMKIDWEMRPGGMLVQKRQLGGNKEDVIRIRVSTGSKWYDVSVGATATFGELKVLLSLVTGLEPEEQRLLFKGKERENFHHLHMVGVDDGDKVLLLEDPAVKERKLRSTITTMSCRTAAIEV